MSRLTFHSGGIHPPAEKELAPSDTYSVLPMPKMLTIPMAQHLGAPAKVTVKKKAQLEAGDVIGEPAGFVSTFIHTPVAGTVKTIDQISMGASVTPVVNLVPAEDAAVWPLDEAVEKVDLSDLTPTDILEKVKAAGIVGMGGATFPTHVKLSPPKDSPVDTVILNGAECEPYLTADDCLMRSSAEAMIEGCRLVMHALGVHKGFVGIEDNKPLAFAQVHKVADRYPEIDVVELRTQYPQGAEKQLIEACTGRRVPPGKLPFSVGALVQNVGTAAAIYEAVVLGRPLARRLVTVSGRAVNRPGNVLAPVGATIRDLIEHCGGFREELAAVVLGGPMMGRTTADLDTPVTKGTSGLLLLTADEIPALAEQPCLRCGKCVTVCPMGLVPCFVEKLVDHGRFDEATDAMDCVECGCCSYTCPSNRRLVQRFRLAKWELGKRRRLEQAKKKAAS
jgi:H+/Na+-translocating ferredoxin:NAD+ oxidoreductase subunit C